ncbi:hypothetical protein ACFQ5N_06710 [Lutibacter holmesii]|uniref:DUF4468 domain-containing protein n=1 Tax=Lutibacter holmesii TaxID=1137985 RepID=A0ABW3WPA8_9FLAO
MKKLLLIITLFIGLGNLNAQTKEETIFWFNEYGFDMLNKNESTPHKTGYEMNQDSFTLTSNKVSNGKLAYISAVSFDCLGKVYTENIHLIEDEDKIIITFNEKCVKNKVIDLEDNYNTDSRWLGFKESTSSEDKKRFLKALKHLAKLCGAKEKPKVQKNTF